MKTKLLLPLLAALFVSQISFAQFHIGVKAGANVTKVEGKSFKDEFRYGYHLGGFAEIGLGGKLGVQPEVLYNQYTTRLDSNYKELYENVFTPGQTVKLNYITIPLLLTYKVVGNFLTLQAGPQFGILVDKSRTAVQNGGDAFKKGDFSMVGGVQLKIAALRVQGRYNIGLNNISDLDNSDHWKNQGFQVSVGLAL